MKKTATRLLAGMLALVLAMLAVPNVVGMEKVQAANDGKVSITGIVAEENDGKIGTSFQYRISLHAPDIEFAYMQADVKIGNGYVCGSSVLYDETSDTYLVPVQKEYYGTYQIADLYFQDANGKTYIFYKRQLFVVKNKLSYFVGDGLVDFFLYYYIILSCNLFSLLHFLNYLLIWQSMGEIYEVL